LGAKGRKDFEKKKKSPRPAKGIRPLTRPGRGEKGKEKRAYISRKGSPDSAQERISAFEIRIRRKKKKERNGGVGGRGRHFSALGVPGWFKGRKGTHLTRGREKKP